MEREERELSLLDFQEVARTRIRVVHRLTDQRWAIRTSAALCE